MKIFPYKKIGILGGGQLGRMTALSAAPLGIECHIFDPAQDTPASKTTPFYHCGTYEDQEALRQFADQVDAITYEFENIPLETVRFLKTLKPVYPDPDILETAQHRIKEKDFLNKAGLKTTDYARAENADDVKKVMQDWKTDQCIIKTTTMGYDGKGQAFIRNIDMLNEAVGCLNGAEMIVEGVIDFDCEISVIICRDQQGNCDCYTPGLNEHRNHILYQTTVPAAIAPDLLEKARSQAIALANALDLVGVLGLELFITKNGEIIANEIAPRPHNSGHWTQNACAVSQFEQQARAVAGLPIGPCERHHDCVMTNLLGDEIETIPTGKNIHPHLYGKTVPKTGRKMGHINTLSKLTKD